MTSPTLPPVFEPVEIPAKYAKAIVAIITAVLTVIVTALVDDRLDAIDLANIVIAFLTAVLVYVVPNVKDQTVGNYLKVIIAFVGTALQALIPFLVNGDVTTQQWLLVLLAAIGALGVGVIPNVNPEKVAAQTTVVNVATVDQIDSSPRHLAPAEVSPKGVTPETGGI